MALFVAIFIPSIEELGGRKVIRKVKDMTYRGSNTFTTESSILPPWDLSSNNVYEMGFSSYEYIGHKSVC